METYGESGFHKTVISLLIHEFGLAGTLRLVERVYSDMCPPSRIPDSALLEELELSVRTLNCLHSAGLKTVGDVRAKSDADLLAMQHFGRRSFRELKQAID